jgi:hypothetical protein
MLKPERTSERAMIGRAEIGIALLAALLLLAFLVMMTCEAGAQSFSRDSSAGNVTSHPGGEREPGPAKSQASDRTAARHSGKA